MDRANSTPDPNPKTTGRLSLSASKLIGCCKTFPIKHSFSWAPYRTPARFSPDSRKKEDLAAISEEGVCEIVITISDCAARVRVAATAKALGFRLCSAVHSRHRI
jgi:hypothetical protein